MANRAGAPCRRAPGRVLHRLAPGPARGEKELEDTLSGGEQSLYGLLHSQRGIVIYRGEAELIPCKATPELRARLELKAGTPLLCMKQVDFDQHNKPVMYSVEYHVADWVRFIVERLGPGIATTDM